MIHFAPTILINYNQNCRNFDTLKRYETVELNNAIGKREERSMVL